MYHYCGCVDFPQATQPQHGCQNQGQKIGHKTAFLLLSPWPSTGIPALLTWVLNGFSIFQGVSHAQSGSQWSWLLQKSCHFPFLLQWHALLICVATIAPNSRHVTAACDYQSPKPCPLSPLRCGHCCWCQNPIIPHPCGDCAADGQVLVALWVVMFMNWILFKILLYPYCSPPSLELRCKSMRSETESNLSDKLIFL